MKMKYDNNTISISIGLSGWKSVWLKVFNTTFTRNTDKLFHIMLYRVHLDMNRIRVVIGTDSMGKSNYISKTLLFTNQF
jgi:hypothetical protein